MQRTLHERFSGPFVKIILGVIGVVFGGFFGIQGYFNTRVETFVAKVDGHEISQQEFRERFDQIRSMYQRRAGAQFNAAMFDTPESKRGVLDQMVNEQLILDADEKLGASLTAKRVKDEISSYPAFQVDGKFDKGQYKSVLANQRRTPAQFEEIVRRDLELRDLVGQLEQATVVTDSDVDAYLRLRDQTRDFRFLKLDKPVADIKIADTDIDAYFKDHGNEFMTPEKVSLEYLELDAAKMQIAEKPDDALLKQRYEEQSKRFVTDEQRLASHILVNVDKNADAAAQKAALEKAQGIAKDAKSGKDFGVLAKAQLGRLRFESAGRRSGLARQGRYRPGVRCGPVRNERKAIFRSGEIRSGLSHHPAARRARTEDALVR